MPVDEEEIKRIIEKADFQSLKFLSQLYEKTDDKCAFISSVIKICAHFMHGQPDDSKQFKSTCLVLSSWKFECHHWNLDQLFTSADTIINLIDQQLVFISPHLLKLMKSVLTRISSSGRIRFPNGQVTNGPTLFSFSLIRILKSNWNPKSILQLIIFFKEILPHSPKINKLFIEKIFTLSIPLEFHSAVIYHLVIIIHKCKNPQLYSLLLQNLKFFTQSPDVFESAITAINQTSKEEFLNDGAFKMLKNFDLYDNIYSTVVIFIARHGF